MSNSPSSPSTTGLRLQPTTGLFLAMLLGLGALLLYANSSADSRSVTRPGTRYVTWTSPDGFFELQRPVKWEPQVDKDPFVYTFQTASGQTDNTEPAVIVSMRAQPTGKLSISGVRAESDPLEVFNLRGLQQQSQPVKPQPVEVNGLKGVVGKQDQAETDPSTGKQVPIHSEIWVLSLNAQNTLLIEMVTDDWEAVQPDFDVMIRSLRVKRDPLVKTLLPPSPTPLPTATPSITPTPSSTPVPTTAPTTASTAAATSAATAAATTPATAAPSPTALTVPTMTPIIIPTSAPETAAPTAAATR